MPMYEVQDDMDKHGYCKSYTYTKVRNERKDEKVALGFVYTIYCTYNNHCLYLKEHLPGILPLYIIDSDISAIL